MRVTSLILATMLSLAAGTAMADTFPSRPVTFISPFAVGGPTEAQLRLLAAKAEKIWNVPVVIDVKPGATATLGPATMAANAKPDGYTVCVLSVGIYTVPWMQKVAFDPARDFTYIIQLSGWRGHMVVRTDAPWKTWKEFVADAKANPGKIPYASNGAGGAPHLNMESITQAAGIKLLHVPFRGHGETMPAILGGHVQIMAASSAAIPLIEAGQFRSLMSNSSQRNPRFPDVPSYTEEGLKPEVDTANPYGIGGPKGMDPAVVKVLHDAIKTGLESPESVALMHQYDMENRYLGSADYDALARQQIASYGRLVQSLGLAKIN